MKFFIVIVVLNLSLSHYALNQNIEGLFLVGKERYTLLEERCYIFTITSDSTVLVEASNQSKGGWDKNYLSNSRKSLGLPDELRYSEHQIGKKFRYYRFDYPNIDHVGYLQKAQHVYQNANKIIHYPIGTGPYSGETHFLMGNDLLRIDQSGFFRSLYPGAY